MDMERDIRMLEEAGADIIHVDVMDGHFVPNLTIGVPFIKQLRAITDLPIDVHLMISNPQEQIDWYLDLDPDYVSVHIEAVPDEDELHTLLRHIRERGAHPALTLKPDMPIEALDPFIEEVDMILVMSVFPGFSGQSYIEGSEERVAYVAQVAKERNPDLLIEVDGGISAERTGGIGVCSRCRCARRRIGRVRRRGSARAIEEIRLAGTDAPGRQGACIAHADAPFVYLDWAARHRFRSSCSCHGSLS